MRLCTLPIILSLVGLSSVAAAEKTVTFQINDELSQGQVDEEMAISINHLPVGTLKITLPSQRHADRHRAGGRDLSLRSLRPAEAENIFRHDGDAQDRQWRRFDRP